MSPKEYQSTYQIGVARKASDLIGIGLEYLMSADGKTVMARLYNGNFLCQPTQGDCEITKGSS